jgi:hypothetical protein
MTRSTVTTFPENLPVTKISTRHAIKGVGRIFADCGATELRRRRKLRDEHFVRLYRCDPLFMRVTTAIASISAYKCHDIMDKHLNLEQLPILRIARKLGIRREKLRYAPGRFPIGDVFRA